jgi:hypothetical protein
MNEKQTEIKITEHLSVKIDNTVNSKISAYVDDKHVSYCSYVLITAPVDTPEDNIDDIIKVYGSGEHKSRAFVEKQGITLETLLWVHASNLQAWIEYDYDPRVLASNIANPLLRHLATVDSRAMDRSLEIVHERWEKGNKGSRQALFSTFPDQVKVLSDRDIIDAIEVAKSEVEDDVIRAIYPDITDPVELLAKKHDHSEDIDVEMNADYGDIYFDATLDFYAYISNFDVIIDQSIEITKYWKEYNNETRYYASKSGPEKFLETMFNNVKYVDRINLVFDKPKMYLVESLENSLIHEFTVFFWKGLFFFVEDNLTSMDYIYPHFEMYVKVDFKSKNLDFKAYKYLEGSGYESYRELVSTDRFSIGYALEKYNEREGKEVFPEYLIKEFKFRPNLDDIIDSVHKNDDGVYVCDKYPEATVEVGVDLMDY